MARPTGKFAVGFSNFSFLLPGYSASEKHSIDPAKHLVGAFFYPSSAEEKGKSRPRWIPDYHYAKGFLQFTLGPVKRSKNLAWKIAAYAFEPLLTFFGYMLGRSFIIPADKGIPILASVQPRPLILLSHGVGGNRLVHSCLCCEFASQGFCVMSLEHADGSASTAQLAGSSKSWLYFQGANGEEMKLQLLHRLEEMRTAAKLLGSLANGSPAPGLKFHDAASDFMASLAGRLDMDCLACIGHSFGGGPSCALPAESGLFKCGIGMDPYWPSLPAEHPVFTGFKNAAPLLLIGSQSWNDQDIKSWLKTASEREAMVFKSASKERGGRGILALVIRGIGHTSFSDAELLYGNLVPKTVLSTNPSQTMSPQLCICLLKEVLLTFLRDQLPLSQAQREDINPTGPREFHPTRQKAQPSTPVQGAEAGIKEAVLGATEEASNEALSTNGAGARSEGLPQAPGEAGQDSAGSLSPNPGLASDAANAAHGVQNKDRIVYENILGQGNVFSLRLQE